MLQKDAKLIFISSVNSGEQTTSFLYNLKNASEKMINVVNYVCDMHMEDFNKQDTLTSCPCYRLYIPDFITINKDIKATTNLLLEGAFTTELLGSMTCQNNPGAALVSERALTALDFYRVETASSVPSTENTLFVYIDPAYTNNSHASGTGIVAMAQCLHNRKAVILGLEHFFLSGLSGTAAYNISYCVITLLKAILFQHPWIHEIKCIVEGNSNQDSAVAISSFIADDIPVSTMFATYRDKKNMQWPIYMLGTDKAVAFEKFITALNNGQICASQTIVSNTIQLSFDPIGYLMEQIKNIKCIPQKNGMPIYQSKTKTMSDDVLIACVMTHYFLTTNKTTYTHVSVK